MKKKQTFPPLSTEEIPTPSVQARVEVPQEKILEVTIIKEELQDTNRYGYESIKTAPRNGSLIVVSETGIDKGEIAFWKKTRAFVNATHRWEETGFFASNMSNLRLSFTPKFWRIKEVNEI